MKALFLAAVIAAASPAPLPPQAFSYDASRPLDVRTIAEHHTGTLLEREISFASPSGRIHAEIVAPSEPGRQRAGVLFVHWLGDRKTTNLTEFVPDAEELARKGCVTLLVDAMWARPNWFEKYRSPKSDFADSIRQVIDLRRSLDVLAAQPGVDPHRIAYVGHDFGAMYGAVLSGVDQRVRWYVLMAGAPTFGEWFLFYPKQTGAEKTAYLARISQLDPPLYLRRSKAEGFLFQFAGQDEYVPLSRAAEFVSAAPLPHGTFIYKGGHALNVPAAFRDRTEWLAARLVR